MAQDGFVVEEGTAFYVRTFEEYRRLFDIEPADLQDRRILDCPGGPSSFVAVAATIGADPVAVDPVYGPPVERLETACAAAVDDVVDQLHRKTDLFDWSFYGDVDTRERYARAAAARFLADYGHRPDRYVAAALPSLPFDDGTFDLVCSSHLLFLYDDRFGETFHRESAMELARVAGEELRIAGLQSLTPSDRNSSRRSSRRSATPAVPSRFGKWTTDFSPAPRNSSRSPRWRQ